MLEKLNTNVHSKIVFLNVHARYFSILSKTCLLQGFSNLLNLLLGVKIGFHSLNRTEFQGWNDFEGIRGIGMLVIDARELPLYLF